jgi:Zn-dependent metalloprotease
MKKFDSTEGFSHVGCPICSIVPPHILREVTRRGTERQRNRAMNTLMQSERLRGHRELLNSFGAVALATPTGAKRRTIYDAQQGETIPGKLVRAEGAANSRDRQINEAYNYSGTVYDFYKTVFGRNSVDDRGMRLDSTVHYSRQYDNAFWNGVQMVYGDGDGELFQRFTKCLDVIGHELTHGVTQYEAGLKYQGQPGALNESFSDVFGVLVKQWKLGQTANQADWLIGAGLLARGVSGTALRSMKAPGTAYDDAQLGKDPQPDHMKDYYRGHDDNGGVHINSGIPNRAFYLTAIALGGKAWERAGRIWYDTLCHRMGPNCNFADAAKGTIHSASDLYGKSSAEQKAVQSAWQTVGVIPGGKAMPSRDARMSPARNLASVGAPRRQTTMVKSRA